MKINLPRDNKGNFDLVVFNKNTEKVPLNDNNITSVICKGSVFKTIIECTKIWYFKGRFGTTWNLKQMLIDDAYKPTQNTVDNSVYQTNMID